MNANMLAALGITREDIIEKAAEKLLAEMNPTRIDDDEEGLAYGVEDRLRREFEKRLSDSMKKAVDKLLTEHTEPALMALLNNLTLNPTTEWGEKKGEPMTFLQFATKRAKDFMQEKVKYNGEPAGAYDNSAVPRVAFLMNKHLDAEIKRLTTEAFNDFNKQLAIGINETVRTTINGVFAQFAKKA